MRCLALFVLLASSLVAQEKPTDAEMAFFARYPAKHVALPTKAPKAAIDRGDRVFRSRLRWTLEDKVNFADHLTVNAWGCGTGCLIIGLQIM